jgi:glutamate-1-semialdehyde 2,1-aminomutase
MSAGIDRRILADVRARESAEFERRTPASARMRRRASQHLPASVPMSWMSGLYRTPTIYVDRGEGASFWDADENRYLDFNVSDLAMSLGFAPKLIVESVARQMARGAHFLLPVEDAVVVAEHLAALIGLPFWQFTLSASGANTEVLRVARHRTGRPKVIIFGGHYHGHLDETLVEESDGATVAALSGLRPGIEKDTVILPFNDLAALERRLERGDIALVLTEPALSNCNLILPDADFLPGVARLCKRHGTLLCIDEAHTFQFAYGGLTRTWRLQADFVVLGKGLGSGVPFGLYGMSAELGEFFTRNLDDGLGHKKGIATGGTTYGSAVAAAVARVALERYWTASECERMGTLGDRLARGLESLFAAHGLPWRAFQLGPRSGYCLAPALPRNGAEARISLDYDFIEARRVFLANRGIWDAVYSAGPQVSFAHTAADIDQYLETAGEFLRAVIR